MKRILIIISSIFLVLTLSACEQDKLNPWNIVEGHLIEQYEGEESINLIGIRATDQDGTDYSEDILIGGSYDLDMVGVYPLNLSVKINDVNYTIDISLEILEKTCEMDPSQDKCELGVTGIEFNSSKVIPDEIYIDDFAKLHWIVNPNEADNKNVIITSSDDSIATVNEYGYVFGKSEGTVTVTIKTVVGNYSISTDIDILTKSCEVDPFQEKCASDILGDDSRIVTLGNSNLSGTDYKEVYVNNKIYYEIYVRKFADSNGNNIGDFQGIIDVLPYLKSIGVGGLWLMPINESRSDHGYEVDDYYKVDWEYGTMTKFEELLSAADNLGIDIIMDLVVNHMGAHNDIFQDVLENGTSSDYYDWFTWIDSSDPRYGTKGSWGQDIWYTPINRNWLKDGTFPIHSSLSGKYYCAYFSDWMPDLNLENSEVRDYLKDVAAFWLNNGVDGFRMDATSHFYGQNEHLGLNNHHENIDFLDDYMTSLKTVDPDVYVVVEAWEGYQVYTEYYLAGVSAFNFQGNYTIKDAVNGYLSQDIGDAMNTVYNAIKQHNPNFSDAVFASNHDSIGRIAAATGSFEDTRQAAEILLTLQGNPFIYYGDEIGMLGTRNNMVWGNYYDSLFANFEDRLIDDVSEQLLDDDSLLNTYKELGAVRNNSLALSYGDFVPYSGENVEGYYRVFENGQDKELVVVLFNFTSTLYVPVPNEFTSYEILYSTHDSNIGGVSPNSTMIIKLPWDLYDDLIN